MSTTRHHINRRRRLANARATTSGSTSGSTSKRSGQPAGVTPAPDSTTSRPTSATPRSSLAVLFRSTAVSDSRTDAPAGDSTTDAPKARTSPPARGSAAATRGPRRRLLLCCLCVLTLGFGAFAGWAHSETRALRDAPAGQNAALTDAARTSQVKGRAGKAVNALFSYDHANPDTQRKAAATLLTGKAVGQHHDLLAPVLAQAKKQKTLVTTTVTDSAVERIDGDRARVLVYADQSSTSTAAKSEGDAEYAGAMLAVDLVHRDGRWLVSAIDTFGS